MGNKSKRKYIFKVVVVVPVIRVTIGRYGQRLKADLARRIGGLDEAPRIGDCAGAPGPQKDQRRRVEDTVLGQIRVRHFRPEERERERERENIRWNFAENEEQSRSVEARQRRG